MSEINAQMYHDAITTCHEFEKKCESLQVENASLRALAAQMAEAGEKLQKGNWHGSIECDDQGDPHFECICGLQDAREAWFEAFAAYSKAIGNSPEIPDGSKAMGEGEGK